MAEIERNGHGVEMSLGRDEAVYVLACLGNSNVTLFASLDGTPALYPQLRDALGVASATVPDSEADETTRRFRGISSVLDLWCGRRNYARARKLAAELGL